MSLINSDKNIPTVSVIIPTYNRAEFLRKAIDSVLHQTFPVNQIIVVDDGSTDHTRQVIEIFGSKIEYYYQENQGVSSARNLGLVKSKSKFISFLDSDDFWHEKKIEIQVAALEKCSIAVAHVCNISWYENGIITPHKFWKNRFRNYYKHDFLLRPIKWVMKDSVAVIPSIMFKADILNRVGLFNEKIFIWEDTHFAAKIALSGPWIITTKSFVFIRELSQSEERLSSLRKTDPKLSLGIRMGVINDLINSDLVERAHDEKILLKELARTNYGYAYANEKRGELLAAFKYYKRSLSINFRTKTLVKIAKVMLNHLLTKE